MSGYEMASDRSLIVAAVLALEARQERHAIQTMVLPIAHLASNPYLFSQHGPAYSLISFFIYPFFLRLYMTLPHACFYLSWF
jgi:hypothetical protein